MHLTDYLDCHPVGEGGDFLWEGVKFTLVRMPDINTGYRNFYSRGLLMEDTTCKGPIVFLTTDTQFAPRMICKIAEKAEIIFHDCETSPFKSTVHAHYDDLCTLPSGVKEKTWLYHYHPNPSPNPIEDGFRGFVAKGNEFDFSSGMNVSKPGNGLTMLRQRNS